MNQKEISNAISNINAKYIQEAGNYSIRNKHILKKKNSVKKVLTWAAAFAICWMLLTQATNVQAVYQILYVISPEITQALKPVRMSCDDQGIRMEVLSASIHGNEAEVYISMQDLIGDRIDDTIDLIDSYRINCPFFNQASCHKISYDPNTDTATFLIHVTELDGEKSGGKKIVGDKITFTVRSFLSHKQEYHAEIPLDLSTANLEPPIQSNVNFRGYGGYIEKILDDNDPFAASSERNSLTMEENLAMEEKLPTLDYLVPSSDGIYVPVSGITITAIGFIDNRLHIQTYYENILETDNHGVLSLVDMDGKKVSAEVSISFWDSERCGSYDETVFLITPDEVGNYRLYGDFWAYNSLVNGNWQVTFPLEAEDGGD